MQQAAKTAQAAVRCPVSTAAARIAAQPAPCPGTAEPRAVSGRRSPQTSMADTPGPSDTSNSHFKAFRTQKHPPPLGSSGDGRRAPRSPATLTAADRRPAGQPGPAAAPPSPAPQVPAAPGGKRRERAARRAPALRAAGSSRHPRISCRPGGGTRRRSPSRAPSAAAAPPPPLSPAAARGRAVTPATPPAPAHLAGGEGSILPSAAGSVPARLPAGSGSRSSAQRLGEAAGLAGLERGGPGRQWSSSVSGGSGEEAAGAAARKRGASGSRSSSTLRTLRSCFRLQSERCSRQPPPASRGSPPLLPATLAATAPPFKLPQAAAAASPPLPEDSPDDAVRFPAAAAIFCGGSHRAPEGWGEPALPALHSAPLRKRRCLRTRRREGAGGGRGLAARGGARAL